MATLALLADEPSTIATGAATVGGRAASSWGIATTAVGAPELTTDSVVGGAALRFGSSDKLRTAAGAAAFLSQGPSTLVLVWRARKYNFGGSYPIVDTTKGGTVAGYQVTVYDNNADTQSRRRIAVRIFDGVSWILDKPVTEEWGHFVPQKWHLLTIRVSATRWDIRVDGKSTHFTPDTISIALPAAATGWLDIGGGPEDLQAVVGFDSFLSDANVALVEAKYASRASVDVIHPVLGLIDVAHPLNPQYTAFPWATILPNGEYDVCCFNGDTESPASNTFVTEQRSADGLNWSAATTIFSSVYPVSEAGAWTLTMSNGHVLRVGYTWDIPSGLGKVLWAQVSTNGGRTYGPTGTPQPSNPTRTDITIGGPFYVQAGGAPVERPSHPGHIRWGVYRAQTTIAGGWDAVEYQSTDYGATWSQVTIGNGTANGHQYAEPQLLFHSSGEERCLIRDYSGGGTPGAGFMVMARSLDGGATYPDISGKLANANAAGQGYCQLASGREIAPIRPNTYLSMALSTRPPGSAWDDPWQDVPDAIYTDPRGRETEMVYATLLETSPGRILQVWGAFTGNAPNTVSDVSAWRLYEFYLSHQMPGTVSPASGSTFTVSTAHQLTVAGAGDYVFAITSDTTGGAVVSAGGLFTGGPANGACTFTVTDGNGYLLSTVTYNTTGASVLPAVTAIWPDAGSASGGTPVTLKGVRFTGATGVAIAGAAASSVVVVDDNTITCTVPAHAASASAFDVSVTTSNGTGTLVGGFSYLPSTLVRQYDASAGVTLVSGKVSQLDELNTNAEALLQLAAGNRPTINATGINGKPAIVNTGATELVGGTAPWATTAVSLCAVVSTTTANEGRILGQQYNAYHDLLAVQATSGKPIYNTADATTAVSDVAINDGAPHACIATWSTADNTARVYVDSTTPGATTAASSTTIAAGGGDRNCLGGSAASQNGDIFNAFAGSIAVGLVFAAALSGSDLSITMAYLKRRGGVA